MPITHALVSVEPDGPDTDQVQPSDWNADHIGGSGGLAIYGDGHAGDVVFDGVAEVEGATLAGGDYTLDRTLYADDVTVDPGVAIDTNAWPIYARGTLTNNGVIHRDGVAGEQSYGALFDGGGGGSGASGDDNGAAGSGVYRASTDGTGGAGGNAGIQTGGTGADPDPWWLLQRSSLGGGSLVSVTKYRAPYAGGSGGGGGAAANGGEGGLGGRGGGVVLIAARHIVNNGTIRALGKDGGDGVIADGGGGGGGQGGKVILLYDDITGTPVEAVDCAGGAGGAGAGTGTAGSTGDDGHLILIANA